MHKLMDKDHGMHKKAMGVKAIILGALILANIYLFQVSWPIFVAILLIATGLLKMIIPCPCCGKRRRR